MATFEEFWEAYPSGRRRVAKPQCEKKYAALKLEDNPNVMPSLERWKCSEDWTKNGGSYIPTCHKWLNQGYYDVTLGVTVPQDVKNQPPTGAVGAMCDGVAENLDPVAIQKWKDQVKIDGLRASGELVGVIQRAINEIVATYCPSPTSVAHMRAQLKSSPDTIFKYYPQVRKQVLIILGRTPKEQ